MKFEFCIPAVPVSNPAVADFGFSFTIVLTSRHMTFTSNKLFFRNS